jgi:hypothetical protein
MSFDPDTYLKEKAGGFDPDAYLKQKADTGGPAAYVPNAADAGEPSRLEAFLRGGGQGATFGFGDEWGGVIPAIAQAITHGETDKDGHPLSAADVYREYRDETRAKNAAAEKAHGGYYLGGNVAGGLLTAPLLPGGAAAKGALGAAKAATLGSALRTGAALGAVSGLGASNADLTTGDGGQYLRAAGDTALGTVAGTAFGGAGYAGAKYAPVLLRLARQKLENAAVASGRRVLLAGADSLSKREPVAADAVLESIRSGAILPGGTTKGAFNRLEKLTDHYGETYNAILSELESRGVTGPNARELADQLLARAKQIEPGELNDALVNESRKTAEKVLDKAEIAEVEGIAPTARLGLKQAEAMKRGLQRDAKYGRIEETGLNQEKRAVASILRQANEKAIADAAEKAGPNSELADIADMFVPVKAKLGNLIEAETAAQRGAARASQRGHFGLPDFLMGAAGLSHGSPMEALGLGLATNLLRNRGPSTAASTAYWGSVAAKKLAQTLAGAQNRSMYGSLLGSDLERAVTPEYQNPGNLLPATTEEAALAAALRRQK